MTVRTIYGQSLLDLAVQEYGSVEGIFRIVEDNSDELLTLNANPFPGMELRIDGPVLDSDVKDYFDKKNLKISGGESFDSGFSEDFNNDFQGVLND